jgi:FHS family L-fucose permease-like MFS transporter
MLMVAGLGAGAMVLISILTHGHIAMWSILAVGLFNSIMFPTIFTLGVAEMGELTGKASGLLVQAIVGGAIIPVLMGHLADVYGLHRALVLPLLCYVFIVYYGLSGFRIKPTEAQSHVEPVTA